MFRKKQIKIKKFLEKPINIAIKLVFRIPIRD